MRLFDAAPGLSSADLTAQLQEAAQGRCVNSICQVRRFEKHTQLATKERSLDVLCFISLRCGSMQQTVRQHARVFLGSAST